MASIQDVADEINVKLDKIVDSTKETSDNTKETTGELVALNSRVAALDAHVQEGFTDLANGIFAVLEVGRAQLVQLQHHSKQHDTMICLLENTNELLCGMTRKMNTQIEIAQAIAGSVARLEGIAERVESAAAGDFDRQSELRAKIEECCPPEPVEPEPCPEACAVPKLRPYDPKGQDWTPRPPREPIG